MITKSNDETFGDFFRRLRRSKGFKAQKDLALASGVSQATLSRIEDGTQTPQPDTLKALAKTLEVTYTELMVAAGYWGEEELLEPIKRPKGKEMVSSYLHLQDDQKRHDREAKENSPPYVPEEELKKIQIEQLVNYNLTFKGRSLTEEQKQHLAKLLQAAAEMLDPK